MSSSAHQQVPDDFDTQLLGLKEALLAMGGRVEQMIEQAAWALLTRDPTLAAEVKTADRRVNAAEIEIDGMCLQILAQNQPMGSDLRFVTRALNMVTDIERIGDLAVNMARQAMALAELQRPDLPVHTSIEHMAKLVRSMLADALDAFVERDTTLARAVIEQDDEVDALHDRVCKDVLARMLAHPEELAVGLRVLEAARFLERMGDHSTNLAEQVVFLVHAEDIRHP
jgi:phosphate transport system protein